MHDEFSDQVDLAPDLEWMLLSDQIKADELLVHLIEDYGDGLSLLMQTMFSDPSTIENALVETFTQIILQKFRYRSDKPAKVWLCSLAVDSGWRIRRFWNGPGKQAEVIEYRVILLPSEPSTLPEWLECFPELMRQAIVLKHYMGLKEGEIADVLGVSDHFVTQTLMLVDKIFRFEAVSYKPTFEKEDRQRLLEFSLQRLSVYQPRGRLRRTVMEMSWAVVAILLLTVLTRIYDIKNPDPGRRAVEIPYLTPIPISTKTPISTPTSMPILTSISSSDEIALRYWQRSLNIQTIWEDALVILGGAQDGPLGHTVKRVEFGWDVRARKLIYLVGSPVGPPEVGLMADESNYYQVDIRNGAVVGISVLDKTQPKPWYYFASLPYNLQVNNFDGNETYRPLGASRVSGRDALLVEVLNSDGIAEVYTWLDKATAIPLRQQRFADGRERNLLVLDVIINQIEIDENLPNDYFNIEISKPIAFLITPEKWMNPQVESSLRRMDAYVVSGTKDSVPNPEDMINYQVNQISNQEGIKYSTSVFVNWAFWGEFPMGNPWSVQCERSPDGKQVAFIEDRRFEFGSAIPSHVLHWFSLDDPGELVTPLPGADATRFTFSPDSQYLAVHASDEVSLINIASGDIDSIISLPVVDKLVFSTDGKYLGIFRRTAQTLSIWIIDAQTKLVMEKINSGSYDNWNSIFSEIVASWQIDFDKRVLLGLENCR